jgi:hypothetical protein
MLDERADIDRRSGSPVGRDVAGYLGRPGLDGGGQPPVPLDHPVPVAVRRDQQRRQDAEFPDRRDELLVDGEVSPHVARVSLQQGDYDHRPPAACRSGQGSSLGFSSQNGPFRCLARAGLASRGSLPLLGFQASATGRVGNAFGWVNEGNECRGRRGSFR